MDENDSVAVDTPGVETENGTATPDFDNLLGVITDGFVGALGGLVGTTVMTVVLLIAQTANVFSLESFSLLAGLVGLTEVTSVDPTALGFAVFLLAGMAIWPLLLASIGSYLPGESFAIKGVPFGLVLWTGFAQAFYDGYAGFALVLYLGLTLLGHLAYGFTLGSVFDYFSNRPETLV